MTALIAANRIAAIGVSEIPQIGARAAAMKYAGAPAIILGAGEPDFDTPDHVKDAAAAAIWRGDAKYTALDGTPDLKAAICRKFACENGWEVTPAEVTVTSGAKQINYNAMMATLNPGDEVIIPTPYWTTYSDIVRLAEAVPVLLPCDDASGCGLQAAQLSAAITPRTRWLILNSPSNPSDAAYSAADYRPLLDVLLSARHVWLMVDDMYEHITYGDFSFVTPAVLEPRLCDRTLTVNGLSKAYAMTGWRIGYAAGPDTLIRAMAMIQSQSTSCPSSISQAAALAALDGPQDFLTIRKDSFQTRRDFVVTALNAIPGITCRTPEGAFYTFANCSGLMGRRTADGKTLTTDRDFCTWLLDIAHIATVPGAAFGLSPYFRISYATLMSELTVALGRITRACASLCIDQEPEA